MLGETMFLTSREKEQRLKNGDSKHKKKKDISVK